MGGSTRGFRGLTALIEGSVFSAVGLVSLSYGTAVTLGEVRGGLGQEDFKFESLPYIGVAVVGGVLLYAGEKLTRHYLSFRNLKDEDSKKI